MSCTLACFEAFLAQNGRRITQRDIILQHPQYCQGAQLPPGWILINDYATLASLLGFQCTPLNPKPVLQLPHYPDKAVLVGAGNFNGGEHSLLWMRALPGDRGLAINPDPNSRNYMRFDLADFNDLQCSFWMLQV
jgi:hypothetical protein